MDLTINSIGFPVVLVAAGIRLHQPDGIVNFHQYAFLVAAALRLGQTLVQSVVAGGSFYCVAGSESFKSQF